MSENPTNKTYLTRRNNGGVWNKMSVENKIHSRVSGHNIRIVAEMTSPVAGPVPKEIQLSLNLEEAHDLVEMLLNAISFERARAEDAMSGGKNEEKMDG